MDASCYVIQGLDCPNCAAKVEQAIAKLQETGEVNLDFAASKLYLTPAEGYTQAQALEAAKRCAEKVEPEMVILAQNASQPVCCPVEGLDCANCAAKVEQAMGKLQEVQEVSLDFAAAKLYLTPAAGYELHEALKAVRQCAKQVEPEMTILEPASKDGSGSCTISSKETGKSSKKPFFLRIGGSVVLAVIGILLENVWTQVPGWISLVVMAAAYLLSGYDILWQSVKNIRHGQIFDENLLMSIASIGAFAIGEHMEGVLVMVLYQIGEFCQNLAVEKSRKSIADLMDIRPESAQLITDTGVVTVSPSQVQVGQRIRIRPGDKVPLDGVVESGISQLDTKALTGESMPVEVEPGSRVLSGSINGDGQLILKVESVYADSTVSKILEMVEHASSRKAKSQEFISRFAKYYTPVVVILAVLLGLIPSLLFPAQWQDWVYRALVFLVVSCPCALVISVPLSFFGGIGGASRKGILVKGSNYLEALAKVDTVVLDKTGTLTKGSFSVSKLLPQPGVEEDTLLAYGAAAEACSNHPMAQSVAAAYEGAILPAQQVQEHPGRGVEVTLSTGEQVLCGNLKLLEEHRVTLPEQLPQETAVLVAVDGKYLGAVVLEDQIKPDAAEAIRQFHALGIGQTVMLTGDREQVGKRVAAQLGMDQAYCQLLPQDKLAHLEALMEQEKGTVAFVGDGINDAPVLARADVGIAMGGVGSGAAMEAADVVIMTDEPSQVANAIAHARRTMTIVKENIVFALAVKVVVLLFSVFGMVNMWLAVFADVGVCLLAILNAVRTLKLKEVKAKPQTVSSPMPKQAL